MAFVGALRRSAGRLGLFNRGFQSRRGDLVPNRRIHTTPGWQILNRWGITRDTAAGVKVVADDKTVTECRTSSGQSFRVSLGAALPPAISFICGDHDDESSAADSTHVDVVAAHGDSVLVRRTRVPQPTFFSDHPRHDYFVYKAAAGEPPSLSLLPTCLIPVIERDYQGYINDDSPTPREFDPSDTAILRRRGKDELLVAQLKVANDAPFNTADLCLLRPGGRSDEWELKTAVPIVHHRTGRAHDLGMWQDTNMAVPVGDRFLCWVNFDCSTFLLCHMIDHDPKMIRYVPLPVKAVPPKDDEDYEDCYDGQPPWNYYRTVGAAGPDAARFVSIDKRCCCGAHVIESACEHSRSAFMVTMWTLTLTTTGDQPMTWVKEAVLDCEELWALKGLSRGLYLTCPVVSPENPDVVCFIACKGKLLWTVEIDVRRKTLISVNHCPAHPRKYINYVNNLPATLNVG